MFGKLNIIHLNHTYVSSVFVFYFLALFLDDHEREKTIMYNSKDAQLTESPQWPQLSVTMCI